MSEWVLWGFKLAVLPMPIKLTGGNLGACNAEASRRKAEGWTCAIYKAGTAPMGLREQAAQASATTTAAQETPENEDRARRAFGEGLVS